MRKLFGMLSCILIILLAALPANAGDSEDIKDAFEHAEKSLLTVEGVAGVSYTESPPRIIVYIESEEYKDVVPQDIKGFKTEIRVSGKFMAFEPPQSDVAIQSIGILGGKRTSRVRPVVGGVSCGNPYITAGTLALVTDKGYILSNAHVIAMNMLGQFLPKYITPILQPGVADGGTSGDRIGYLYRYIKIRFGPKSLLFPNRADAAVGKMDSGIWWSPNRVLGTDDASEYSVDVYNYVNVNVGDAVRKSGRTTKVTTNEVIDTHATVIVWYGPRFACFKDQILVKQPFIQPGDSGSAVDKNGRLVGLVFAGSSVDAVVCKARYFWWLYRW